MKYGKNLTWILSELSLADAEQFESGSIEIIGENEQSQEGSIEVEISDLAGAAKDRIEKLEHALTQILELSKRDSEHFGGQRKDIAERAKETLNEP